MSDADLPRTCSGGGPIILLPAEVAAAWRGTSPPVGATVPPGWTWGKSGGPVCDYDRACDPPERQGTEYGGLAWLDVADGRALVLDGELETYWIANGEGGVVARGGDAADVRGRVPASGWTPFGSITLRDGRVFLFDSAYAGAADPREVEADDGVAVGTPGPGTYDVAYASVASEDFIRFVRRA
jgi:hypothetical protein